MDAGEIGDATAAFARASNGGLMVTETGLAVNHHVIATLAARHKLPAVYSGRIFVGDGGVISCGPDNPTRVEQAAACIDRIMKSAKPVDLPVHAHRYELLIARRRNDPQNCPATEMARRTPREFPPRRVLATAATWCLPLSEWCFRLSAGVSTRQRKRSANAACSC